MMTLRRFESLADSYGGQLRRWPEDSRGDAEALLRSSAEARRILDRARLLDETIGAASANSTPQTAGSSDSAALARLRAAVAIRLDTGPARRRPNRLFTWLASTTAPEAFGGNTRWVGMAACGAAVVVAGVITGLLYAPPPTTRDVLSMLQPEPIQIFSER
jgi:hypothetical protein